MKQTFLNDVPVFMVFFNRPEPLEQVFQSVKKARPSKLFLCQDGPRQNRPDDIENITKCREVVSDIDWKCEVYYDYSEKNLGCGMRIFSGLKNAFEKADRLIIIEDDCVPSQDFYPFCKELLEKYRNDERIKIISGMNHLGQYCPLSNQDYFFTKSGSIWGWATWKRAWDNVEWDMPYLDDKELIETLSNSFFSKSFAKSMIKLGKQKKTALNNGERLTAWSYQHGISQHLYNQLNIVPRCNMITNIGLTVETTNGSDDIRKVPKGLQVVFMAKTYKVDFPLKHPKYIIDDVNYRKKVFSIMGWTFWRKWTYKIEGICRQIIYGDGKKVFNKLLKKLGAKK